MIQDHQGLFDSLRTDEPDGGHQVDGRYLLASASQKVLVPAEKKRQISFVKSLDHKIAGRIAELLLMNNIHGSQLGWGKRCNILHPVNALTVSKERRGLVLTNPSFVKQLVRLAYTEKLLDWEGPEKSPKRLQIAINSLDVWRSLGTFFSMDMSWSPHQTVLSL